MENFVKGKRVLFMGDSITALYLGKRGWPKYFAELLEPAHTACTAVAGARWRDYPDTVWDGNPRFTPDLPMPHNTMCNQMEKIRRLHAAGDPDYADFDVVLMACGTNDGMPEPADVTDAQFYRDGAYVPLADADTHTWGGAIRHVSESLDALYPNAVQFILTPIQADDAVRPFRSILEKGRVLNEIAARLSVRTIDMLHCGIYGRYEKLHENGRCLVDGLHPNEHGARQMGHFAAMAVRSYLG